MFTDVQKNFNHILIFPSNLKAFQTQLERQAELPESIFSNWFPFAVNLNRLKKGNPAGAGANPITLFTP